MASSLSKPPLKHFFQKNEQLAGLSFCPVENCANAILSYMWNPVYDHININLSCCFFSPQFYTRKVQGSEKLSDMSKLHVSCDACLLLFFIFLFKKKCFPLNFYFIFRTVEPTPEGRSLPPKGQTQPKERNSVLKGGISESPSKEPSLAPAQSPSSQQAQGSQAHWARVTSTGPSPLRVSSPCNLWLLGQVCSLRVLSHKAIFPLNF